MQENCLLDAEGHLVLTDFGLSKIADEETSCNSLLGTLEYMAPEILAGQRYNFAVDWWSFGILCYELLTGAPPFSGKTPRLMLERIITTEISFPYYLSVDARDLLSHLLCKEPSERLGATLPGDIDELKKHGFFKNINWPLLERKDTTLTPPIVPIITDPLMAENFEIFSEIAISPDLLENSRLSNISSNNDKSSPGSTFKNFTYVASSSFIEQFMKR